MKKTLISVILLICLFSLSVNAFEIFTVENSEFEDRLADYSFTHGLAKVWRLGESAIINNYGKIIIDYSDTEKAIAPNGLIAILGENEKIGFYNKSGEQVTDFIYDSFIDIHEKTGVKNVGYTGSMYLRFGDGKSDLLAASKDKKFGYINSYGTVVIPFKYEYAYGFCGGIARVCADGILSDYGTYTNGKYGFIKEDGTEILPPDSYWVAYDFDNLTGYATATNGANDTVFIDRWGNYAKYGSPELENLDFKYIITNPADYYYGIEDKCKNTVIPAERTERIIIKGDKFIVNNSIRNNRNEIIYKVPENVRLHELTGELLSTTHFEGGSILGTGCIDLSGKVIFPPEYDFIRALGDGLISTEKQGEYCIYDTTGRLLWKLNEKPVAAFDGFITVNNPKTMLSKIIVNQFKHPVVFLNGEKVRFPDAYPIIVNDRTMIPIRAVFEKAGASVNWDGEERRITVSLDVLSVSMKIDDTNITVNGAVFETDMAPILVNDRTYIPLRAFSEGLGMKVLWDGENYTVNITK